MTYHDIPSYIDALQCWKQTPATIYPDGSMTLTVKGKQISKEDFEQHNSKPVYMPMPKVNPNGHVNLTGAIPRKTK